MLPIPTMMTTASLFRLIVALLLVTAVAAGILVTETGAAGKAPEQSPATGKPCLAPASWTIFVDDLRRPWSTARQQSGGALRAGKT